MNGSDQFNLYSACNRVITSTDAATGAITGFRMEMQRLRDGSTPCVELRFTDGEGGVYMEAVCACYADTPYASVMTTAANFTINTAGHKFYVKPLEPWYATTITDTVGGGELHLVIPEGYPIASRNSA